MLGLGAVGVAAGVLVSKFGVLITLAAFGGAALIVAGLARPPFAMALALFGIYSNLPVVAVRYHGAPALFGGLPLVVLG
ncbi:MAG: hypothetical protein ACYS7M_07790, partial [Planctomycetota bacterium]